MRRRILPGKIKGNVGFTGTQQGMTKAQKDKVDDLLKDYYWVGLEFHHGDCIGADAESAFIARNIGFRIASHPPLYDGKRAFCNYDVVYPEKPYLDRNHDIVDSVRIVIATPKEFKEVLRSGTWATIRYAKRKKFLEIVFPDGTVETFNQEIEISENNSTKF